MTAATSLPPTNMSRMPTITREEAYEYQEAMTVAKGMMTVVYILVFVVGTPGNIWIIYKLFKTKLFSTSLVQMSVSQRSRIYIFLLACSDMILLATLLPSASYNYFGAWVLGSFACYSISSIEMFAKLFSVTLLTVMSLERYIIVCTKFRELYNNARMSIVPLVVGTVFGVIIPTLIHTLHLKHFKMEFPPDFEIPQEMKEKMGNTWLCLPEMNENIFNAFACYTFFVGFIIPFGIMTICYFLLVHHVKGNYKIRRAHTATVKKEPRYMTEVRRSVWRIAVFHFVCWAPFWGFTMLPHFISQIKSFFEGNEKANGDENSNKAEALLFVYCRLVANCLPYINAAGNWVLYALLNVDVRKHIHNKNKKKRKFNFWLRLRLRPASSSV